MPQDSQLDFPCTCRQFCTITFRRSMRLTSVGKVNSYACPPFNLIPTVLLSTTGTTKTHSSGSAVAMYVLLQPAPLSCTRATSPARGRERGRSSTTTRLGAWQPHSPQSPRISAVQSASCDSTLSIDAVELNLSVQRTSTKTIYHNHSTSEQNGARRIP